MLWKEYSGKTTRHHALNKIYNKVYFVLFLDLTKTHLSSQVNCQSER